MSLNLPFNSCTVFFPLDFVSMLENLVIMATLKICKRHKQESITIHEFQWKNAQKEKSYRYAVINSFVSYLSFRILDYYVIPSFLFLGGAIVIHPQGLSCYDVGRPQSLELPHFFPLFMKIYIAINWLESLKYTTKALQYQIAFFEGLFHSLFSRRAFATITLCWLSTM